jgi:multidrug efflux pump subunit AcrB
MEDPELSQRGAMIVTRFPGASAYRVESLVTEKIEQELFEIAELETIRSTSRPGVSTVVVELKDEITNGEQVWSQVRDKLDEITPQLPQGALSPEYQDVEVRAYTMLAAITWKGDRPTNYAILTRLAKDLEEQLRNLKGTEKIEVFGTPEEEIVVEINPADLAALSLTPQELARQIQMSDAKVAAGQLRGNSNELLVELDTELDSLDRIRQIPITLGKNGQVSRLGDLAQVNKGIVEPPSEMAIVSGKPAAVVAVLMESDRRIDKWSETANQTLAQFQQRLPASIGLQLIFDQSRYVESRLNGLLQSLLLGAICVVLVTILLMGWRSALIVTSALPLSVLMVFGGMRLLSIPLHQMSVTGLVIALGMLIDNAIVVVDEIQHKLRNGFQPSEAVAKTISYLAIPLLASTLTTIITFMPIALLPGGTGEFVRSIAFSVILALLSSLFISLTIIPALTGRLINSNAREQIQDRLANHISRQNHEYLKDRSYLNSQSTNTHSLDRAIAIADSTLLASTIDKRDSRKPSHHQRHNQFPDWWHNGFSHSGLTSLYRQSLDKILSKPRLGILLALIIPLIGFVMASSLDEQFFPPAERDQLNIELELPSQSSIEQTRVSAVQARKIILAHPEVSDVHWFFARNAPTFYYNIQRNRQNSPHYAQGFVQLTSNEENSKLIQTLQDELDRAFPSIRVLVRQLEQGPVVHAPIELRLYGPDLGTLKRLGNQVRSELASIPDVIHTRASMTEALPKIALQVDEEQARLAGLDNTTIAQQLDANLEGSVGGSVLEATEELPVRVRLSNSQRSDLDQIASLELVPNNNNHLSIPLTAVSKMQLVPELATIPRRHGQRVNTIEGFIEAGTLPSTALKELKQRLKDADFQLPSGYSIEFGGESAERNKAVNNLMATVGILFTVMATVLVLSFGSFRSAGIIALVGLGSIGLGFEALWMFNYPLGFMAILGIVGLIGVAINDSIVVLAALSAAPLASEGNLLAIREVIVRSTRHVITTTITTIAGFIPLLVAGGQFWPPLAICIAGGVGGATILAIYLVPCVYLMVLKRDP